MATVTDWITHLTTDTNADEAGTQVGGSIYPGAGSSELLLVLLLIAIWIGWHAIQSI